MSQSNAILTHIIGKESKIVVRQSKEVGQSDFFFSQYRHAIKVAEKIVENADASSKETSQLENVNNIIAFIGDRGSGKTSCMLTFANILVDGNDFLSYDSKTKEKYIKADFYQLPAIDPSFFSEDYNIIGAFIATIYRKFQSLTKDNQGYEKIAQGKVQDFYKALADAQRSFGRLSAPDKDKNDDMERLEQLSCSMKLKDDIKTLTDCFLECIGEKKTHLLIAIDDIDLNTKTAVDMVEWIRKYLIQPNIIILFAVKLDQLIDLKRLKLFSEYKDLLEQKKISESEMDEMAERYLAKLIPLSNRVYMPDLKDTLNLKYEVISSDDSISRYKSGKFLRDAVVELIFEKTRYLFYNSATTTSLIVPRNLREVLHLMRMLFDMKPIEGETNDDGTNDQNRESSLSENQTLFKEYVFNDFLYKHLNSNSRQLIEELLSVDESIRFNATILEMLSDKFSKYIKDENAGLILQNEDFLYLHPRDRALYAKALLRKNETLDSNISQLLSRNNIAYNISTGDVLGVIDYFDSLERTDEEFYFLFIVKFIYSIRMYEYYNNIFKINLSEISKQEKEGKLAYSHTKAELKEISDYHKLIAGHLFNFDFVDFIPESNNTDKIFSDGCISIKEMKNYKDANPTSYKFIEFLMLCTSGPIKTHDTIKQKKQVKYAHVFANQTDWVTFDLYSFFYNITDIETCYRRFDNVFSTDYIKEILSSDNTLWSDFYKAANFYIKDKFDENKHPLSVRNDIIESQEDFMKAFNALVIDYKKEDGTDKKITISDSFLKHNWLSWCCIRNIDVYEDFSYYLDDNRNKSYAGTFVEKIINFFTLVFTYRQATHDFISSDKAIHYKLNFTFVGIVVDFLTALGKSFDIEKYIVSYAKRESLSSKTTIELSESIWNAIMDKLFVGGTKKVKTVLKKLDGMKGILDSKIYDFVRGVLVAIDDAEVTKETLTTKIKEADTKSKIRIGF